MLTIGIFLMLWIAACLFFVATTYGYYKARSCYDVDVFTNRMEGWDSGWKAGFDSGVEAEKGKGYSQGYEEGWKKGYDKGMNGWEDTWLRGYQQGGEALVETLDSMNALKGSKNDILNTIRSVCQKKVSTPQVELMEGKGEQK